MTKVSFERGGEGSLPTAGRFDDGVLYVAKDSGNAFLGRSDGSAVAIGRTPFYGTCPSAKTTVNKTVTLLNDSDRETFELMTGVIIVVRFAHENQAVSPTLNVNGTGAIGVKMYGTTPVGSTSPLSWFKGECVQFVYDGSYWMLLNHVNETNSDWDVTDESSAGYIANKPSIKASLGTNSIKEGDTENNTAFGDYSHAEGRYTRAVGSSAHVEGLGGTLGGGVKLTSVSGEAKKYDVTTNTGNHVFCVGECITCNGVMTYITEVDSQTRITLNETVGTVDNVTCVFPLGVAIGEASHVECNKNVVSGNYSHAEGFRTIVGGNGAHAEGYGTNAVGHYSHTEGANTIAKNLGEHAEGNYNVSNTGSAKSENTTHSVGIGTSQSNRKNAFEIMQNGDVYVYGIGGYDGTNIASAQTLQQVIQSILNAI